MAAPCWCNPEMTNATRLLLFRHGETQWNLQGRYQGHLDSPLTELGQSQARAAGQWLAQAEPGVGAAYTSDLGRARHTARLLLEPLGLEATCDARLRERHMGILQGELHQSPDPRMDEALRLYRSGSPDARPEGGESMQEVIDRSMSFLHEVGARHLGQTVVVVSHGAWLALLLRQILGVPLDAPRRMHVFNTSLQEVRYQDNELWLWSWGGLEHLRG